MSAEAHGDGKFLGGGMVGTCAGDMIGEVALAIEMGADAVDIGKTIHPHPTLGESIGMLAGAVRGSCAGVPSARKNFENACQSQSLKLRQRCERVAGDATSGGSDARLKPVHTRARLAPGGSGPQRRGNIRCGMNAGNQASFATDSSRPGETS